MKLFKQRLYLQVRDEILNIINTETEFMGQLPSEQDLSERMGVSRNTVREAIKTLENEGYVIARQGVGTFVIRNKSSIHTNLANLDSSTKIIANHGYTPGTQVIKTSVLAATGRPAHELRLGEDERIFYLERIRTADDKPVVLVKDYIPYVENMEHRYREEQRESLLAFLESFNQTVSLSVCDLSAVISDSAMMDKLKLSEPTALLQLSQTHHAATGQPILYSDSFFLCSDFKFSVIRKATGA